LIKFSNDFVLRKGFDDLLSFKNYYTTIYRTPQYLVGMLFGYAMHSRKNTTRVSRKTILLSYLGWIVVLAFFYDILQNDKPLNLFLGNDIAFLATFRLLWTLGICCVIYECHQYKTGSLIRWILCLRLWQPLSKLGLSIYVVQALYILKTISSAFSKSSHGIWFSFMLYVSDYLAITAFGAILYLTVEAPTGRILAMIWKRQTEGKCSKFNLFERFSTVMGRKENRILEQPLCKQF
jgi:peptidoglycan/LPS O-acetylase OafA/YrhL